MGFGIEVFWGVLKYLLSVGDKDVKMRVGQSA